MSLAVVAWPEPHPLGSGDEKRERRALTPCRAALSRPCPGRRFGLYLRRGVRVGSQAGDGRQVREGSCMIVSRGTQH